MDYKVINLKELALASEDAGRICELEIEQGVKENIKAIKFIHGYGSHGVGGGMLFEVRRTCKKLQDRKIIDFYIAGHDFNTQNSKTIKLLFNCKDCFNDDDLNHSNPGITIVYLK